MFRVCDGSFMTHLVPRAYHCGSFLVNDIEECENGWLLAFRNPQGGDRAPPVPDHPDGHWLHLLCGDALAWLPNLGLLVHGSAPTKVYSIPMRMSPCRVAWITSMLRFANSK
jgi:hypothetical protein